MKFRLLGIREVVTLVDDILVDVENKKVYRAFPGNASGAEDNAFSKAIKLIEKVKKTLAALPPSEQDRRQTRSVAQVIIHDEAVAISVPIICRKTYATIKQDLATHYKMDFGQVILGVLTARRVGKTTCTAMLLSALALCVPNYTGIILAPTIAQAAITLIQMESTLKMYFEGELPRDIIFTRDKATIKHKEGTSVVEILASKPDVSLRIVSINSILFFCGEKNPN